MDIRPHRYIWELIRFNRLAGFPDDFRGCIYCLTDTDSDERVYPFCEDCYGFHYNITSPIIAQTICVSNENHSISYVYLAKIFAALRNRPSRFGKVIYDTPDEEHAVGNVIGKTIEIFVEVIKSSDTDPGNNNVCIYRVIVPLVNHLSGIIYTPFSDMFGYAHTLYRFLSVAGYRWNIDLRYFHLLRREERARLRTILFALHGRQTLSAILAVLSAVTLYGGDPIAL